MCLQKKEIVSVLILSIITCGIYGLYWLVVTTDDVNETYDAGLQKGTTALLLSIITCGIYGLYWQYSLAKVIGEKANNENLALIALLCSIFSAGVVGTIIMQDEINKLIDKAE